MSFTPAPNSLPRCRALSFSYQLNLAIIVSRIGSILFEFELISLPARPFFFIPTSLHDLQRLLSAMFRSLNTESLRKAASSVFSKPNFRNVRWAGVFGLFAVGSQTKSSNVDVIVILMPHCEQINSHPLSLEDELFRVWGRKPRIQYIRKGEFWHLTSVKALLCSRTLAGSDQDDEVVRLRNEARTY